MSKHITDAQLTDVLGDLQDKADDRFAQGGDIIFSTDNSNNLQATKNGQAITIGGGGGADVPLSVVNGQLCITYGTS